MGEDDVLKDTDYKKAEKSLGLQPVSRLVVDQKKESGVRRTLLIH